MIQFVCAFQPKIQFKRQTNCFVLVAYTTKLITMVSICYKREKRIPVIRINNSKIGSTRIGNILTCVY